MIFNVKTFVNSILSRNYLGLFGIHIWKGLFSKIIPWPSGCNIALPPFEGFHDKEGSVLLFLFPFAYELRYDLYPNHHIVWAMRK